MHLTMLLEMAAEAGPDRVAVGSRDGGLTYARLLTHARALGAQLAETDATSVAVLDLNTPAVPTLVFGAAAAGIPIAPLNYRLTDDQVCAALHRLAPALLVIGADWRSRIRAGAGVTVRTTDDIMRNCHEGDAKNAPGESYTDLESPAVLLSTSGTTGEPKSAVLRHRHLTSYIVSTVEFWSAAEDETILVSVPNYHIAGISSVLSSVYAGRRMVQLPSFTPQGWVDLAAGESATHAMVVPTMLGRIVEVLQERGDRLPALRSLSYGGGRMPIPLIERAMSLLPHVDFVNAYGLTETSSTIAVLGPDDHREALQSTDPVVRTRLGSVGRPLPSVELEVRSEQGQIQPPGTIGEVFVRGQQVAGEYLSHSALDADGWYLTRDRGYLDSAGFLYLDGRADDIIVRGGENISPGEIEAVLSDHPAVIDAAVVGVADPDWGERVEAVIVAAPDHHVDLEELRAWVRERLRSTRVPSRIHTRPALPYSETGKLLRRQLRDELAVALP